MTLPAPPFKAVTRDGHYVEIIGVGAHQVGGIPFPLRGRWMYGSTGVTHYEPVHWQANGKFDMPNDHPHPLDLVGICAGLNGAVEFPFPGAIAYPNTQQGVTHPAAPCVPESQPNEEYITMAKIINGISVAALTEVQARIINQARNASPDKKGPGAEERRQIKREVFAVVKAKFGIPENTRVKANTTGTQDKGYLVLHDKQGRAFQLGDNGQWNGQYALATDLFPPAPAPVVQPPAWPYPGGPNDGGAVAVTGGEVAQTFQPVVGRGAGVGQLPEGVKVVAQDDDNVLVQFNDDWEANFVGPNDDRILITRR